MKTHTDVLIFHTMRDIRNRLREFPVHFLGINRFGMEIKMRKRLFFCLLLIMILMFSSCASKSNPEDKSADFMEYKDFTSFFNNMNQDLKLSNYENLGGNEGVELVYIDAQLSFGKRNYLTLDNKQSNLPTQQRIEYMANNGKSMAVIDLIYLETTLNNDLIFRSNPLSDNGENEFIRKTFAENIISYKNILVKISLFATDSNESEPLMLREVSIEVVDYIKSIESKE